MRQQSRREFKSGNGGNCPLGAGLARRKGRRPWATGRAKRRTFGSFIRRRGPPCRS